MPASASGTLLSELVRSLGLAWKNLAAYPPGHPSLAGSLDAVHRRLAELRGPAPEVSFGIAVDGIVYGYDKIESPQAQKFAHALYVRGVAVLRIDAAADTRDLEVFLRLLGVGDSRAESATLWDALTAAGVEHIRLQPVDYSAVQVTSTLESPPAQEEPGSLWEEIVRALMAGHELSPQSRRTAAELRTVDELSALILRYVEAAGAGGEAEFDPDATFGVRINAPVPEAESAQAVVRRVANAIGLYVAGSKGLKRQFVVQQIAQLLRSLPEQIRAALVRSVLGVLATDEGSGSLLREFAGDAGRDAVLHALRDIARSSSLSSHALTLLKSLAAIGADPRAAPVPAGNVTAELLELFGDEDIDRFNPPDHSALLAEITLEIPNVHESSVDRRHELGDRVATLADGAVNAQLGATMLELLDTYGATRAPEGFFARLDGLLRSYLSAGQYDEAIDLIARLQSQSATTASSAMRDAIRGWFERAASAETIQVVIAGLASADPAGTAKIHRLIAALGSAATRSLLVALAEEESRSRRRKLFDFLVSLGPLIVPEVTRFLADARWYVVRNMIVLLRAVNDRSAIPEIRKVAGHADLRVRMEAIKALLALEPNVPRALLEKAINDPDPKLAETAITLVGSYGIREAVGPLLEILDRRDVFGARRPVRVKAIRALGELAEPSALPRMAHFFNEPFLPWPSVAERRVAYETLAAYPPAERARFVEIGLQSRDPQIRDICRRLAAK